MLDYPVCWLFLCCFPVSLLILTSPCGLRTAAEVEIGMELILQVWFCWALCLISFISLFCSSELCKIPEREVWIQARESLEDNIVRVEWKETSGWKDEDWESWFWNERHSVRMTRFRDMLISGKKSSTWQKDANFFFPSTPWKLQMCFLLLKSPLSICSVLLKERTALSNTWVLLCCMSFALL